MAEIREQNKDEISIVTAFFDINRKEWKGFERGADKYIDDFGWWASIENKLVVYVENEAIKEKVLKIRADYNLQERTKCIVIENIYNVESDLYKSIKKASRYENAVNFRLKPANPESWSAEYNYIMLMKEWCVQDAVKKGYVEGMIAWVDFGFNKGGLVYTKKEEFTFEWKYRFAEKINIFALRSLDSMPAIFEIVRNMSTYIQGGIIVAPDYRWIDLWRIMKENMLALNKIGLMDDDQTILLMALKENPEWFEVHYCDWMMQFKKFGCEHLTIREKTSTSTLKRIYINSNFPHL